MKMNFIIINGAKPMKFYVTALSISLLTACSDAPNQTTTTTGTISADGIYAFDSRVKGESSVSYSGQTFRQVLIGDLKGSLSDLTADIEKGYFPAPGDISSTLSFYFDFDGDVGGKLEHGYTTDPGALQVQYQDISSGKNLVGKIAGNDATGQTRDWSTDLRGFGDQGSFTPESLVRAWFDTIDAAAVEYANGNPALGPDGTPVPAVYVTAEGQDLQQLLEKFILGAVTFSQGTDDYLDDDIEGKGLLSDHTAVEKDEAYTALEHGWDEGFGYFGASRYYAEMTDVEIADDLYADMDGDGAIDLLSEVSFAASINAAKRDKGASKSAPTDFTGDAYSGFYQGRAIIAAATGALTDDELDDVKANRDRAIEAWEKSIAATVVHYINGTLQDMNTFDTADYNFGDHAKHWSELKGFAMWPQFNPRSPMTDADFDSLHAFIGEAPVLPNASADAISDYRDNLVAAKELLASAYDFEPANLGDENGENGW
jgi:hypothetical protein